MGLALRDHRFDPQGPGRAITRPPRLGRNQPCHCGSQHKYKRCCLDRDQAAWLKRCHRVLPAWLLDSRHKLHQFEKYACKSYGIAAKLGGFTDSRRDPEIATFDVVNSLFHAAVLRIPSMNALEGDLKEADFQKLLGQRSTPGEKTFSADVVANVLDKLDLTAPRQAIEDLLWEAERNKVFREGSYGTLRCVAIDGWEPFCSYDRCCPHCLVRKVTHKNKLGEEIEVDQYYHRYVVAMLVGPVVDVAIGIEPVRNQFARQEAGDCADCDEGELTAAHRLLDSLHKTYGTFIDAFIFDGLYPNGPILTKLDKYHYGAFLVLKKDNNEPLKEALALWQGQPPCEQYDDPETKEHIDFWDVDDLETLDTYKGKIRVLRAVVTKPKATTQRTWCVAIVGERARKVGRKTALKITRARWHIENTGFHQWVTHWNLSHVFRHSANAVLAVLLIWMLAFNLLQLFVYRRLQRPRRPKDPTDTIRHIVEVMMRDVATLPEPIPWAALLDSS